MTTKNKNGGYVGLLMLLLGVAIIAFVVYRTDLFTGKKDGKNMIDQNMDAINQAKAVKDLVEQKTNTMMSEKGDLHATYTYKDTNGKTATVIMSSDGKSVTLTFENIKNEVLPIAMSGSGARYANKDESIVFWNKGEQGMVLLSDKLVFDGLQTKVERP